MGARRYVTKSMILCFLISLGTIRYLSASSVLQVSIAEATRTAELVFQGRALSVESRRNARGDIHTYVTFQVIDLIKGKWNRDRIELSFLGGAVGNIGVSVAEMDVPQVHEVGIYFVESINNPPVNPFVGWSQGHFLIAKDNRTGIETILTFSRQPVIAIDTSFELRTAGLSTGIAAGVTVSNSDSRSGLSAADFKRHIRALVARGK